MVNDYRPISLLPSVNKIFDKALKFRLMTFIEKYKLISDRQYGFRPGMSTNDAISALTGEIYKNIELRRPTICVFLNLAKAFDTVGHAQLLETLANIGIRGNAFELSKSIFSNR